MEIVIIGVGNTATVLGKKLKRAGHKIVQVFGREAELASELASNLDTEYITTLSEVDQTADIYIIAVNDAAIEEVVKEIQLPNKIVVHTAASVSKDILSKATAYVGVFYPLQSLKKDITHIPITPIIIDASDIQTLEKLKKLAYTISDQVVHVSEEDRSKLHLAAVFCNNFVNHIYVLMEDYCNKEHLDFNLLKPLIQETAERINDSSAKTIQTGPAVRNDTTTINKHLMMLHQYPHLINLYQVLTNSIRIFK